MIQAQKVPNQESYGIRYEHIPFYNHWEVDQSQISRKMAESFFRNPQYQYVYKNFDYTKGFHVWIGEGNYEYKQTGYMKMISFPYKDYMFDIGDYITCIYDNKETTWLVKTITKNHPYECIAHIEKTNNWLKWIDEYGNLRQYRCVVDDKMLESFPGRSTIVHPQGNVFVDVKRDLITSKIVENQKFIFGGVGPNVIPGQAYLVYGFKNFMNDEECNEKILSLELKRENADMSTLSEKDDLYNNIADYYKRKLYKVQINNEDITQKVGYETQLSAEAFKDNDTIDLKILWETSNNNIVEIDENGSLKIVGIGKAVITARLDVNNNVYDSIEVNSIMNLPKNEYYQFSPLNIETILQGDEENFSIYHCIDNVPDDETFRLKVYGVPNENKYKNYFYEIEVIDGTENECNKFKLINNRAFYNNPLYIDVYSNTTGKMVGYIHVRLGGLT